MLYPTISSIDLAIVIVYIAMTIWLGLWLGGKQESVKQYFLADRALPAWALLFSIVATETSTVTFLSIPGVSYAENGDFRFLQAAIGFIVGRTVAAFWILPGFFRGSNLTSYQILQDSFGTSVRRLASFIFMVTRTLADALRLYLTALVLREVVQLELWMCITLIGFATMAYTYFGGMRSVVWNDCIQFLVYMAGAICAFFVLLNLLPEGWNEVVEYGKQNDKFRVFDFDLDPCSTSYTFWIGLLGGSFLSMATHGTDQLTVQRLLSSSSQSTAAFTLIASGFVVFLQFALFLLIGVGLACFYQVPGNSIETTSNDQVFASFIVNQLPIGVVGLILAAVFSAAMSTLSSSLNASASALVNDFLIPSSDSNTQPSKYLKWARVSTLGFGALQILIAIVAEKILGERSAVYNILNIAGFASGPILGLFFLTATNTKTGVKAALIGMFFGLLTLTIMATVLPQEMKINGFYYCMIGSLATFGASWLIQQTGFKNMDSA